MPEWRALVRKSKVTNRYRDMNIYLLRNCPETQVPEKRDKSSELWSG